MTVEDVAQLAGRNPRTVYLWAQRGHLGRRSAPFRRTDVESYLATKLDGRRVSRSPPPAPDGVAARCHLCRQPTDLSQLVLVVNEAVGALACYRCLADLLDRVNCIS